MLSTPLDDCNMSESSEFTPPMAEPLQLLDCFTTPKAKYNVNTIGITQFGKYLSCLQCN